MIEECNTTTKMVQKMFAAIIIFQEKNSHGALPNEEQNLLSFKTTEVG